MKFNSLCPIMPSRDLRETRTFYEAIGFETQGVWDEFGYMIMARDNAEVHFSQMDALDPVKNPCGGYLRLKEVDALSDRLATLGLPEDDTSVPRFGRAVDTPWGMRETAWVDHSGNGIRAGADIDNG